MYFLHGKLGKGVLQKSEVKLQAEGRQRLGDIPGPVKAVSAQGP